MNNYSVFNKEHCGQPISAEESQKIQLNMLDALAEYCDTHDLHYFLSGGTLLGAVRHKGFIPWDDDIDVNMPRPDCEKLFSASKGRIGEYILTGPDMDGFAPCCESYRLYNFKTVIESFAGGAAKKNPIYYPIFIDIFPIEGLPDTDKKTKRHYRKLVVLRKMQRASALKHMQAKTLAAHVFHLVSWVPAKLIGYKRWSKWVQQTVQKYSFEKSEYVGVMTAPVHTTEERVKKAPYMDAVEVSFEGKKYHAPGNYDTYLSQLYGNYMKMPPKEKQQSHHQFNMYWRKA